MYDTWKFALLLISVYLLINLYRKLKRKSFKDKVVLITGCSSGIGEELALQFAKLKSKLVLCARREEPLRAVVEACRRQGVEAIYLKTDVTKEDDCRKLIEKAVETFGKIDVLVLNAGQGCLMKLSEVSSFEPLRKTMEVNYWGCVYPTFYALPHLRNSKGAIVLVGSLAAKISTPRRCAYAASKAAITSFLNCLRVEEPSIQITCIHPGFVKSEIHEKAFAIHKVERDIKHFMTASEAARKIINAIAEQKREEVMTFLGKLGNVMNVFSPGLVDLLAKMKSEASVKIQ